MLHHEAYTYVHCCCIVAGPNPCICYAYIVHACCMMLGLSLLLPRCASAGIHICVRLHQCCRHAYIITCDHCSSAHLYEDAFETKKHTVHVYITHEGHRCRATHWHRSSCNWLMVTYCLASGSLLHCRLPQNRSMHVSSKQLLLNRLLPPNLTQKKFHILCNQHCFLCFFVLQVLPLGIM